MVTMSTKISPVSRPPRILVAGAAYGGLCAVLNLLGISDGKPLPAAPPLTSTRAPDVLPHITLLDERDGIFHSMGTPLIHVQQSITDKAWVRFNQIPALKRPNVQILQGSLVEIDPLQKRAFWRGNKAPEDETDRILQYDYLIVATGLKRAWPIIPKALNRNGYIEDANGHVARIEGCDNHPVVVVGGGAVGTEFAAEIKHHHPDKRVVLIHSRQNLMSNEPLPDEFKEDAMNKLKNIGIELILETRVLDETPESEGDDNSIKRLKLSNGTELLAGHTIWATTRHVPRTDFLPTESVNQEGFVKVLSTMQFASSIPNSSVHFAAGDIADWSGIRRVGRAFSTGQYAATNIMKLINTSSSHSKLTTSNGVNNIISKTDAETDTELSEFPYVPPMISLALGKTAVMYHPDSGLKEGEELYKASFGPDLGLSVCWNHLNLPFPEKSPTF